MRFFSMLIMFAFTMNVTLAQFQNSNRGAVQNTSALPKFVPGEFVVKFRQGANLQAAVPSQVGNVVSRYKIGKATFGLVKSKLSHQAIRASLNSSSIEYIEPNYIYYKQGSQTSKEYALDELDGVSAAAGAEGYVPNDEFFTKLWGLNNPSKGEHADIDALKAWELTTGDKKIIVAVIDTGIDYNHPELKNNIWSNAAELNGKAGVDDDNNGIVDDIHGASFASSQPSGDPMDDNSHGTHCSGTIAASHNAAGVAGVMANVSLMGVKFLTASGSGTLDGAVKAINYATQMGAHVMSNSWGGGGYSKALEDAIKAANEKGIVFVAAAGNSSSDNDKTPGYPSSYEIPNVVAVAAHDINDKLAKFSSYGLKSVHIAAPGVEILSTVPGNKYAIYSGTSMATPHVSGVVGLMLSKANFSALSPAGKKAVATAVRAALVKTATSSPAYQGKTVSGGRTSSGEAITALMSNPATAPRNGFQRPISNGGFQGGRPN